MKNIILFLLAINFSCKNQINEDVTKLQTHEVNVNSIDTIKKIIEKQVMHGYAYKEDGLDMEIDYIYKEADYNAIRTTSIKILKNNNFNLLSKEDFQKKVLKLFNFNKIEVNFLIENSCPLEKILYQLDVNFTAVSNNKPLFIDSENKMLIEPLFLPELINYKNEYANIYKNEEKIALTKEINGFSVKLIKWKDLPDLDQQRKKNIQTLVARNMYLFNDSKAHFKWLILNDEYFMRSLVTTFGYYDDKELLKWAVEKTNFNNDFTELDKLFWNKKCDGTVKLNADIYLALKEIITPTNNKYLGYLKEYVNYLIEDNSKKNNLSLKDRAKLLAHLVYFGEQYRYDKNYNDQSFFMQRIELLDLGGVIKKEIEKNGFYGLSNYKDLYKKSEVYQDQLTQELE